MHEQNPMLGLRGCRLGLMIPDFVKIQTRAILNAPDRGEARGRPPASPKIMIPLVGHVNELAATRELLEAEAKAVAGGRRRRRRRLQVRHDDRGPARRARPPTRSPREADFFSFGTNDLTQMTFGYSRDDAEGGFLLKYVEDKILPGEPVPDARRRRGRADEDRRRQGPRDQARTSSSGICGEHGGDPDVDRQVRAIGLDYVSCSPFRVPVARLAAAQAVLERRTRQVAVPRPPPRVTARRSSPSS